MRIPALTALAFVAGITAAGAQDTDAEARLDVARDYLSMTARDVDAAELSQRSADGVILQLRALDGDMTDAQEAEIRSIIGESFATILREVMLEQAEAAAALFTLEEITALRDFYASDIGRAAMQKSGLFVAGYQPEVTRRLEGQMPMINARILEVMEDE